MRKFVDGVGKFITRRYDHWYYIQQVKIITLRSCLDYLLIDENRYY